MPSQVANPLYKLTVAYDGTRYFGWQKTKSGPTIQEAIQKAIQEISQEDSLPEAASRTDRGVHAQGQVIAFSLKKQWNSDSLRNALNAKLPPDIRVKSVESVAANFHPTLDALEKEYPYSLCLKDTSDLTHRLYSWAVRSPISLKIMEQAIPSILGTRDFSSLANEPEKNPICTLREIHLLPLLDQRLKIVMKGDRFLYKMARNIAGALVDLGRRKIPPHALPEILSGRDRKKLGSPRRAVDFFFTK